MNRKIANTMIGIVTIAMIMVVCALAKKSDIYQIETPYVEPLIIEPASWEILDKQENEKQGKLLIQRRVYKSEYSPEIPAVSISFGYVNAKIRVFFDDSQIYSFGHNGKKYVGNESGDSGHFIRLPVTDKDYFDLKIEMESFFPNNPRMLFVPEVALGTMAGIVSGFSKIYEFEGYVSYGMICLGVMGLLFSIAFLKSLKKFPAEYISWSLFVFLAGIGYLMDSHFVDFEVGNTFLLYFIPTITLAIEPFLLNIYIYYNKTLAYNKKVMSAFSFFSCVVTVFDCLVALLQFIPFSYAKFITHIFVIVFMFFMIAIQITECLSFTGSFSVSTIVYLFAAFSLVLDLGMSLVPPEGETTFIYSRPVFLIFFIVQSIYVINDFFNVQVLSARKELYEDAVNHDLLTGTRTRPSFWKYRNEWPKKNSDAKQRVGLVLCEITNLKKINETYGFDKGDEILKNVASFLQYNFPSKDVFRFDGSGFAAIMEGVTSDVISRKIEGTKKLIKEFNNTSILQINISFGYDMGRVNEDLTFDAFVNRVQILLYGSKQV